MTATRTISSLNQGKRIVICATNKRITSNGEEHTGTFFALYNTVFNLTEYIFEDYMEEPETFKDVQINENTNYITIISESHNPKRIKIRGFDLNSNILYLK